MWLCRCVDRVYGTTCWAKKQQARQRSRQVGAERWASLEHEHFVKLTFFPPAVPGRTRGRCRTAIGLSVASAEGAWLARVRVSAVSAGVVRGTVADARGGGNREEAGEGGLHHPGQTQTADYLVTTVC